MDGLRAPFIIHALNETHTYDDEFTVILGDVHFFLSPLSPPNPASLIFPAASGITSPRRSSTMRSS